VGVRFGGSELHRIGISSSHTRHPPLRAESQPTGCDERCSSECQEAHLCGTGNPRLFGRMDPSPPKTGRPACSQVRNPVAEGQDLSPGGSAPSYGARHAALFGESGGAQRGVTARGALRGTTGRPHRDREPEALRSAQPPISPEARTLRMNGFCGDWRPTSSEARRQSRKAVSLLAPRGAVERWSG
jgi:hypothetical protein